MKPYSPVPGRGRYSRSTHQSGRFLGKPYSPIPGRGRYSRSVHQSGKFLGKPYSPVPGHADRGTLLRLVRGRGPKNYNTM